MLGTRNKASDNQADRPALAGLTGRFTGLFKRKPTAVGQGSGNAADVAGPSPLSGVFDSGTRNICIFGQVRDLPPQQIDTITPNDAGFALTFVGTAGEFSVIKLTRSNHKSGWALSLEELQALKASGRPIHAAVDQHHRLVWLSDKPDPAIGR